MAFSPKQVKRYIKSAVSGMLNDGIRHPICLVGTSGIGKSQIIAQVAEEMGLELIDKRLAQMDPGDLIGIPRLDPKTGKTVWGKPCWWPTDENSKGILLLDEANRAPIDMRQAVFQLLTEFKIHECALPKNWFVIIAINPDNGSYQVEEFDPAMRSRLSMIEVKSSFDDWCAWGKDNIDSFLVNFLINHRELFDQPSDKNQHPCPRSWHKISDLMKCGVINFEEDVAFSQEVMASFVGSAATTAFIQYRGSLTRALTGEEVLKEYSKHRKKVIAKARGGEAKYTNDMFAATSASIAKALPKKLDIDTVTNLFDYLDDSPAEHRIATLRELMSVDGSYFEQLNSLAKARFRKIMSSAMAQHEAINEDIAKTTKADK